MNPWKGRLFRVKVKLKPKTHKAIKHSVSPEILNPKPYRALRGTLKGALIDPFKGFRV